jgi:hypothetical protein
MALAQACDSLKDHFLSIPEPPPRGAPPDTPSRLGGGRWIIEHCWTKGGPDSQFTMHLDGPAWQWVDRSQGNILIGGHLEGYIYVVATLEIEGRFRAGYDTSTKIMSAALTLLAEPKALVQPMTAMKINVQPSGLADLLPTSAVDEQAWTAIHQEGTAQLYKVFRHGITLTRSMTGQQDFSLDGPGAFRPYSGPEVWMANARQVFHPAGITVDGPFPPGVPILMDATIVQGQPVGYHAYCAPYVRSDLEGFFRTGTFTALVNRPDGSTTWIQPGQRVEGRIIAAPPDCASQPWAIAMGVSRPTNQPLVAHAPPTLMDLRIRTPH